jgi:hypothetical protein
MDGYLKPDGSFHFARSAAVKASADDGDDDGKIGIGQHFNKPEPIYEWLIESKFRRQLLQSELQLV